MAAESESSESETSDSEDCEAVEIRHQSTDRAIGLQSLSILETCDRPNSKGKPTTHYCVNVKIDGEGWVVVKRIKNFQALHSDLAKRYSMKLPYLPPKKLKHWRNHNSRSFIEKRRTLLDNYCKKLLLNRQLGQCSEVITFFSNDRDENLEFCYEFITAFPRSQEVTDLSIPKFRKMTDHIP